MNINKQYVSQPAEENRKNSSFIPRNLRRLVKKPSPISCVNQVGWTTITCMCLEGS